MFERKLVGWRNPDENIIGGIQGEEWEVSEFDAELKTSLEKVNVKVIEKPEKQKSLEEIKEVKKTPSQNIVVDDNISQKVLETVVEHTGYPADFIEFDQDLEGELGVDSVKQAEIMADLRAHFKLPIDEDFVLSEYPTLNHMMSYIAGISGKEIIYSQEEEIPVEKTPLVENIVENEETPSSKEIEISSEIKKAVLEVVVEHTGYPEDFIGFDQDLEAELGVDSVKQAEMMGDLRSKFNIPIDESFVLSEHPTLNHIAGYISRMSNDLEMISEEQAAVFQTETIPEKQKFIEVSNPYTIQTDSFQFTDKYMGLEVIEKAGTVIGHDGKDEVTTPYDSCVLIMPTLRQSPGTSAVRFGKFIQN